MQRCRGDLVELILGHYTARKGSPTDSEFNVPTIKIGVGLGSIAQTLWTMPKNAKIKKKIDWYVLHRRAHASTYFLLDSKFLTFLHF